MPEIVGYSMSKEIVNDNEMTELERELAISRLQSEEYEYTVEEALELIE